MTPIKSSISSLVNIVLLKAVFLAVTGLCLWYATVGGLSYLSVGLMLLGGLSALLFEGHALPIAFDEQSVTFHHGWRKAQVSFEDMKIISASGGARKPAETRRGYGLVLEGKQLWQWYFLYGDPQNKFIDLLVEHGLELPEK